MCVSLCRARGRAKEKSESDVAVDSSCHVPPLIIRHGLYRHPVTRESVVQTRPDPLLLATWWKNKKTQAVISNVWRRRWAEAAEKTENEVQTRRWQEDKVGQRCVKSAVLYTHISSDWRIETDRACPHRRNQVYTKQSWGGSEADVRKDGARQSPGVVDCDVVRGGALAFHFRYWRSIFQRNNGWVGAVTQILWLLLRTHAVVKRKRKKPWRHFRDKWGIWWKEKGERKPTGMSNIPSFCTGKVCWAVS